MSFVIHRFIPHASLIKDLRKTLKQEESQYSLKSINDAFSGFAKNADEAFDIAQKYAASTLERYEYLAFDKYIIDDTIKVKSHTYYKKVYDNNVNIIGRTTNGWNVFIMVEGD